MKEVSYRVTCKVDYNEGDGIVEHDFYFTLVKNYLMLKSREKQSITFLTKILGFMVLNILIMNIQLVKLDKIQII